MVTKGLQNLNYSVRGAGHTVTLTTVSFGEKLLLKLLQPPYQDLFFAGDVAWSHGVLRHRSWVLNLIFTWALHWLISSSGELVHDERFAMQSFLPRCPIAFFILFLGAEPGITIKSKPLPAFY